MRFLFARRKETKGDPPSLQSSSDESSKSGESEEAVLTSGISPSSSFPLASSIKASPQRLPLTATAAASTSRKAFTKTPSRKNGYSFVAEAKAEEEALSTAAKGRFGFVRLVSRVRTRSYGPPKEETPYAPPPSELEPLVPAPDTRPVSPTADLWTKLFGSTIIPPEPQDSPDSSRRSKSVQRRFKVTVEDGISKQKAPLLRPPPQPMQQPARQQLVLSQQFQQQQQQQEEQEQEEQQQSSPAANERHVHYRDEVSEISAKEFTASFIYDEDDDDFNDETSRSVATGTSSLVSDRTGTTGDSTYTDMSGYTSTVTELGTEGEASNTTPRRGSGASRFGHFRCDGVGNDIDDDEDSGRPPQGLAEGLMDDFKSVLTDLARDILCLVNQKKAA